MAFIGKEEGKCRFAMVWAESWDADWSDRETWPEDAKVIGFAVEVSKGEDKEEREPRPEKEE